MFCVSGRVARQIGEAKMSRSELLSTIRQHRGEIFVGVLARSDVIYVKAVKSDLLSALKNIGDDELTASISFGSLYIDNAS
jgi:hypothetical protein